MKNIINMIEDLFVAVAFAEAGEYDPTRIATIQFRIQEAVRMHT